MPPIPPDRFKVPSPLWDGVRALGLSPTTVVAESHLPLTLLRDEQAFVTTADYFGIWRAIEQLATTSTPGLAIATAIPPGTLPPAMVAAYHARDLRDALARMARYKRLCSPEEMDLTLDAEHGTIEFIWHYAKNEDVPSALVDAAFASVVELARHGTNTRIQPRRVELRRNTRAPGAYEAYFGCAVITHADRNLLVLNASDLPRTFRAYNAELLALLQNPLEERLQNMSTSNCVREQTKWIIKRLLVGANPTVSSVARELGVSERTLQRRIAESATSFRELVLETRRELACDYLTQHMPIAEVAYLVGYEDLNSFYRAFRQWEGITPAQWRATNNHGPRNDGTI